MYRQPLLLTLLCHLIRYTKPIDDHYIVVLGKCMVFSMVFPSRLRSYLMLFNSLDINYHTTAQGDWLYTITIAL